MDVDIVKYNIIREALANNEHEEHDIVRVPPQTFALKKEQSEPVLGCAVEVVLHNDKIQNGITPHDAINVISGEEKPRTEQILYVLAAFAVAIQQGWIEYSSIFNRYFVNRDRKEIVEYVEDVHKIILP